MSAVPPHLWHADFVPTPEDWENAFDDAGFRSAKAYIDGIVGPLGWANVQDYYGPDKTDAALAMRNAIASGKKVIYVPQGTYLCKSAVTTYGSATNPSCFELRGCSDVWILAHGATFTVANPILINGEPSFSTPVTTLSITSDSKHCGIVGARFDGNYTGLIAGTENVAVNLASVTGVTLRDLKISGAFLAAISGVFIFDSLIENVQSFNNAIGLDIAHVENLTVHGCRFEADPTNPVTGINQHYDVPTLGDNNATNESGSGRGLIGGKANRLKVLDCTFVGFANSISMEAMHQATVARNTIRGLVANTASAQCGVLLYCGVPATNAGQASVDTLIVDNEITGCGNIGSGGGGGVFLGTSVSRVALRDNRIYDNVGYGLAAQDTSPTFITSLGDDFNSRSGGTTQIAPWPIALDGAIAAALGQGVNDTALTVTHGVGAQFGKAWSSTVSGGAAAYLPNNTNFSWYDSHGTPKPIIGLSPGDDTFLRPGADTSTIRLQNTSGVDLLWADTAGVQIFGPATLSSTLGVAGAGSFSSTLGVAGAVTFGSTLGVSGAASFASTLAVAGAVSFGAALGVTGNATVGGTLGVTGSAQFSAPWTSTVAAGAAAYLPNNTNLTWYDSSGAAKPIIGVSPGNETFIRPASDGSTIRLQSASGVDLLFAGATGVQIPGPTSLSSSLDVAGAVTVGGSMSLAGPTHGATLTLTGGAGFFGASAPTSRPSTPVTLADVIAIIRGCGLAA